MKMRNEEEARSGSFQETMDTAKERLAQKRTKICIAALLAMIAISCISIFVIK